VSYFPQYETYLVKSDPPKSLKFIDEKFEFNFLPVENGIIFQIKNIGEKPAFLEWDRSYFIEPDGNSYKALNTDLLHENVETKEKAKYESVIPPNGIFQRFTTSALNSELFTSVNFTEFNSGNISTVRVVSSKITGFGRYWPGYTEPSFATGDTLQKNDLALEEIKNYMVNKNKMGLGISVKMNDTISDYKFDFRFRSVKIWKVFIGGEKPDTTLFKKSSEDNGWLWNY
jgi:hypothetical protein